ncbi:MAG: OadG family protein [Lachnospiraceae bacterium]
MKKKISLIIGMCLIVLGLTACGQADPTKVDYNGYTYQQLQDGCQKMATALESLSSEELQQYKTAEDELMVNLVTRWEEARTDVGDFAGMGEFKITKSGKTLTCEQEIKYEQRPVILTYVYNAKSMELEDVTVDQVKTLGEKMENAALNTLLGMGTVFAVLILISLIISCFRIFPYLEKKKQAKNVPEVETAPVTAILEQQDDLELVAVIAAAVAASTGTSTEDFVVRSIKRRF